MRNREGWVADTLVELSDMLTPPLDPESYLLCVADRYMQLIASSSVRLTVAGERPDLPIVVNTDERLGTAPLSELLDEEGPGIDCRNTGEQIVNVLLDEATTRWRGLAPAGLAAGYRTAHAFPFSRRQNMIGTVTILTTEAIPLPDADLRIAGALADVTTISLLNHHLVAGLTETTAQLQGALTSRVIIEQAKGLISARLEIDPSEAFHRLRRYARGNNQRIADVSEQLISRRLTMSDLMAPVRKQAESSPRTGR